MKLLSVVQVKVRFGLDAVLPEFNIRERVLGHYWDQLEEIRARTKALVTLGGRGSGILEPGLNAEAQEPLFLRIV